MSMISRWPVCCSFVRSFASRSACSATFGMSLTTTSFLQIYTILRGTMLYVFVNRGMHACGIVCVVCVCEYHCSLMIKWYRCDPFFLSLLSSNSIYSFCSSQPWFNRFSHSNANNILHLHHVTLHNIKITKKRRRQRMTSWICWSLIRQANTEWPSKYNKFTVTAEYRINSLRTNDDDRWARTSGY